MLLSMNIGLVSGRCRDQRPLLELRNSLTFNNSESTKLVNWNSTPDCCEWPGITCDEGGSGRVISLDLSFEGINGGLDDSSGLFSLQFLQNLNLSFNSFSTPLPASFANLTDLISLNLSTAGFIGQIPNDISKLTRLNLAQLEELILDGVNISAQGSDWGKALSSSLPNLKVLSMSSCYLSGPLDASLAELRSLSIFRLSYNNLSAPVPEFLANYPKLTALELSYCELNGIFPQTVFQIPTLEILDLTFNKLLQGYNAFTGKASSLFAIPSMQGIRLSNNKLEGPIPSSVFDHANLNVLDLSSNKLNGTVELHLVQKLSNLTTLDLSYNNLTVIASGKNSNVSSPPQFSVLRLASCNLRVFPDLRNQSELYHLDLSDNQITGPVPGWISELSLLQYLNLSRNLLVHLERPLSLPGLITLDLHRNQLQGSIPVPPSSITYVDYSSNNFSSYIPPNIGNNLSFTVFFSLSNNHLTGAIPQSICNTDRLQVLDLSNNSLSGAIPSCLIEGPETLRVLNLRRNNFDGFIPDKFPRSCGLKTLDLSGNNLRGKVPKSLANCTTLEVLDLGNNQINDSFPCLLKSISSFRVLVLRNNTFSGLIGCPGINGTWPRLQIVDLAFNHFRGNLPHIFLETWEGMMEGENRHLEYIKYELDEMWEGVYYQDSITVTFKGLARELTFSADSFEGNQGLCGPPSNLVCSITSGSTFTRRSNQRKEFDWNFLSAELGYIFGLGIVILPLMFCKRWRTWYCTHVDRVIFRVFPQLDKRSNNLGRRAQRNRRRQ
ncbi:LEUCINE-RICH REPEAT RECEPTOR PROTEIN KINASE EMS1-LIKE-RELATED [Salix purpurea]|uniref:LEUCINE-RICH REPEAT RECEPTOR PROTEIN KINASE EMS1-LIKE-RELATED n=1 Tax=Salix purpurea TaxID=77065 RepID=A0A9Q1A2E8_SALPP|nr:LEUCINE-RICH REPEAT RECEPTOR PROTEIN KINASE EMS1-LIKE-RELATED [Salix purpurea]